jgi:hypothetical protein
MPFTNDTAIAGTALVISLVAGSYTVRSFLLKAGTRIRGSFSITSSITCDDKYVSDVTLYNMKDRAVVVLKILLQLGRGYYIELDNFESSPLILHPFEAWHREYEPIEMYTVNMRRINLEELLDSKQVKRRLVLSTADGRYVVRDWIRSWNPDMLFFQNNAAAIIRPRRSQFDGKSYGSNALYIVEVTRADGEREVVPIYRSDHSSRKFRQFQLTAEALGSARRLEEFLLTQAIAELLPCRDLRVHDLETWRATVYEERANPPVKLTPNSWFRYHVLGRLGSRLETLLQRRENRARHKAALGRAKVGEP